MLINRRELKQSLETLRLTTDKQATSHLALAQNLKQANETPLTAMLNRQNTHRKNHTTQSERFFKNKQTQESYVAKAKATYESDCMKINSYTAQCSILQGKELDRTRLKLDRAQTSVHQSEREYKNFVRALKETQERWEREWKDYCDSCQDLEEERTEFLKNNMWDYANNVSTVCVADDEVRVSVLFGSLWILIVCFRAASNSASRLSNSNQIATWRISCAITAQDP
jgi:hypothetical protein